jgi:hypothetical protein
VRLKAGLGIAPFSSLCRPCYVLESIALEGYRARALTTEEVRQLLGLEDRFAVHEFLAAHGVSFYTMRKLEDDLATLDRMQAP